MALVKCRECGNSISEKSATCPFCGLVRSSNPYPVTITQIPSAPPVSGGLVTVPKKEKQKHIAFLFVSAIVFTAAYLWQAYRSLKAFPDWQALFITKDAMAPLVYFSLFAGLLALCALAAYLTVASALIAKSTNKKSLLAVALIALSGFLVFSAVLNTLADFLYIGGLYEAFAHTASGVGGMDAFKPGALASAFTGVIFLGFSIVMLVRTILYLKHAKAADRL